MIAHPHPPDSSCCCSCLFCIYYSFLHAAHTRACNTKRCSFRSASADEPAEIPVMPKKPSRKLPVRQHGLATVVQTCSTFPFPTRRRLQIPGFFAGFNNLKVKVASFPSLPWLPFCLCLSKCAVCLCVAPVLISRIAHELSPTVSSLSPPLALPPTQFYLSHVV